MPHLYCMSFKGMSPGRSPGQFWLNSYQTNMATIKVRKSVLQPSFLYFEDGALIYWWGQPIVKPSSRFPFSLCTVAVPHLYGMSFKGMTPSGGIGQFWLNSYSSNLEPEPNEVCSLQCSLFEACFLKQFQKKGTRQTKTYFPSARDILNSNNC